MEDHNSSSAAPDFLIRIETKELEELSQYIKEADIELHQAGGTLAPSNLVTLGLDNIHLQVGSYGSAVISHASSDKERFGLLYKIDNLSTTKCNGYHMDNDMFIAYGNNSEHIAYNDGPCRWAYITLERSFLEEHVLETVNRKIDTNSGAVSCFHCGDSAATGSLVDVINEITVLAKKNPSFFKNDYLRTGMEYSLLEAQIAVLGRTLDAPANGNGNGRGKTSHSLIIKRSADFLKANSYKPIHVTDLCSALGVRMRTLYYAFQEFYGISPINFLKLLRLTKARKDLLEADPKKTSVTDVAAKWHFWHFGRFSVEYKNLYGESPSATLGKAGQR